MILVQTCMRRPSFLRKSILLDRRKEREDNDSAKDWMHFIQSKVWKARQKMEHPEDLWFSNLCDYWILTSTWWHNIKWFVYKYMYIDICTQTNTQTNSYAHAYRHMNKHNTKIKFHLGFFFQAEIQQRCLGFFSLDKTINNCYCKR